MTIKTDKQFDKQGTQDKLRNKSTWQEKCFKKTKQNTNLKQCIMDSVRDTKTYRASWWTRNVGSQDILEKQIKTREVITKKMHGWHSVQRLVLQVCPLTPWCTYQQSSCFKNSRHRVAFINRIPRANNPLAPSCRRRWWHSRHKSGSDTKINGQDLEFHQKRVVVAKREGKCE